MLYTLSDRQFVTEIGAENPVALRVPDGAQIQIRTIDCYSNGLRAENDPRGEATVPLNSCNPASGAIYIEDAQPGDTLAVEILSIDTDDYGTMRVAPGMGFMGHRVSERITRAYDLRGGQTSLSGAKIALEPMIGVIGVAPKYGAVPTHTPGAHGGNMDTRYIRQGSTLYLPVQHSGALLSMGDVHAQMGDGEVAICGIECPATIGVRVKVIKGRQEEWPVLLYDGIYRTLCSGQTLDEAARIAADAMLDFLLKRISMDVNELIMLMSLMCDLEISQVVDPLITARMALRPGAFEDLKF